MKIILIGNNTEGQEPYMFLKPDSALLKDNKPFFIPDFTQSVTVSLHPVIRISRLGKNIAERFAPRYYDAVTVGLDITAADIQEDCIAKSLPWEASNGFDGSAVIGKFVPVEHFRSLQTLHLKLDGDGQTVQKLYSGDFLLDADKIIALVSKYYTMKTGDLIYLGTSSPVDVQIGERLQGYLEQDMLFDFHIR